MKNFNTLFFTLLIVFSSQFLFPADIQGQTIQIGEQEWMTQNLNVDHFRNGDSVPHARTSEEWEKAAEEGKPAWCYYENDSKKGKKYGKLYNWYAINDPRGLAPEGWKLPDRTDWNKLLNELGGKETACEKFKTNWKRGDENKTRFTALPAGARDLFGNFYAGGSFTAWWIASGEDGGKRAVFCSNTYVGRNLNDKRNGFSVRCVKE